MALMALPQKENILGWRQVGGHCYLVEGNPRTHDIELNELYDVARSRRGSSLRLLAPETPAGTSAALAM